MQNCYVKPSIPLNTSYDLSEKVRNVGHSKCVASTDTVRCSDNSAKMCQETSTVKVNHEVELA